MFIKTNAVHQNKTIEISLSLPMQIYLPKIVILPRCVTASMLSEFIANV